MLWINLFHSPLGGFTPLFWQYPPRNRAFLIECALCSPVTPHFILLLIPSLLVLHPSALPVLFQEELTNKEATEGEAVTLRCKLSKSAPAEWKKGNVVLKPSEKYKIEQEGPFVELTVRDLDLADAGDYSCVCGDRQTTAALAVNGKKEILTRAPSQPVSFQDLFLSYFCFLWSLCTSNPPFCWLIFLSFLPSLFFSFHLLDVLPRCFSTKTSGEQVPKSTQPP